MCSFGLWFLLAYAISVDSDGDIYVLASGNNRVTEWMPGATTGILVAGSNGTGTGANQLDYPIRMFIEPNTSIIWIADTYNNRIVRWESPSTGVIVCGSFGVEADQFQYPQGLFVDIAASKTLYVADTDNHRIQMWLTGAINGTTLAGQTNVSGSGLNHLSSPSTLLVDTYGNMYIVDTGNNRILRWMIGSPSGMIIAGSSTYGVLPHQLYYPTNIRFDGNGALLVVDSNNNRIQKFSVSCGKFSRYSYLQTNRYHVLEII
jgi:sugar lactone lactonase YvrE